MSYLSPVSGHWGCSHPLASVNSFTVNTDMRISALEPSLISGVYPEVDSTFWVIYGAGIFVRLKGHQTVFHSLFHFTRGPDFVSFHKRSRFSTSVSMCAFSFVLFDTSHQNGCKVVTSYRLFLHFLGDCGYLLSGVCILAIYLKSVKSFAYIWHGSFVSWVWSSKTPLCTVLWILIPYQIWLANISSHSISCLFILFIIFSVQKLFEQILNDLLPYCCPCFGFIFQKWLQQWVSWTLSLCFLLEVLHL